MAEYEIIGTKQITELPEATAYEDGMYYAVAKAGAGTKKINADIVNNSIKYIDNKIGQSIVLTEVALKAFSISSGDTITIEKANGGILPSAILYFYDSSKQIIPGSGIPIGSTYGESRTLTLNFNASYIYINTAYDYGIRVYINNGSNIYSKIYDINNNIKNFSPDVIAYITSTSELYAAYNGSSWYFKAENLRLFKNGTTAITISWNDVITALTGYIGNSPDGTINCVVLNDGRYLYYCWDNSTLNIATNIDAIPQNSTILLAVIGSQPYGIFWNYLVTTETKKARYNAVGTILTTAERFSSQLVGKSNNIAKFGFFSDPHWLEHAPSTNYDKLNRLMQELKHLYDSTAIDFVCCGGDWLNNGGTKTWAIETLGYINGLTHRFKKFYNVVGNHDTNYIIGDTLSNAEIKNAYGVSYYSFDEESTHFIVLDTGTDSNNPSYMDSYKWEQIEYLANELTNHNNNIIILHAPIVGNPTDGLYVSEFAKNITSLSNAYNNKTTITLNNIEYNFVNAMGKVWALLGGHQHTNNKIVSNNIPIYIVANGSNSLNCYLTIFDFDNETVKFISTLGSSYDWDDEL